MEKTGDFYNLLGVHKAASREEIRAKYHELALLFHPDRVQAKDKEAAHRVFVRINLAYRTLIDPEQREQYDMRRAGKHPTAGMAAPQGPPLSYEEVKSLLSEASDAYLRGDLQAAHAFCRRIIKAGKAPLEAYVLIGDIYVGEKQKEKALTAYQVALKIQPDNKMLQTKIQRLESLLGKAPSVNPIPSQSNGAARADAPAGKRSFLSRIADIRAKKPF